MGQDKSLLPITGTGELLWQRQLRVLNELQPQELFWSGPAREGMPAHVRVMADAVPDAGPLAGIAACLDDMRSDLLIVLAVDLPQMTSIYLAKVLARCTTQCGTVPRHDDFYEPLAAVYPKGMLSLADQNLSAKRYALQNFASAGIRAKMLQSLEINPDEAILFKNVNRPEDL